MTWYNFNYLRYTYSKVHVCLEQIKNLPFLSQQIQILIRSLLRCRRHTDICYPLEKIVVSWSMRENKILVLHTVTNYFGTNLICYDINDLILAQIHVHVSGKYISPCYQYYIVAICSASIQSTCAFEFKIVMKLLNTRA